MSNLYDRYIIICEGKSEDAYIQELNRCLRDSGIYSVSLIPKPVGTGHYIAVAKEYKKQWSKNKNLKFYIWVDKDIYERNDDGNMDKYKEKPENIPDFSFNIFNFEDFLILHFPKEDFLKHRKLFEDKGHFKKPLHDKEYEPLIKQVFKGYEKGSLPDDFIISKEILNENLFANNNGSIISKENLENLFANNKSLSKELQNDFANELDNIVGKYLR
jgi:hypothetical protein